MAELNVQHHLARQYRAALEMLGQAIELCTEELWLDPRYPNPTWHVAYHVLFYTQLYVQPSYEEFRPWAKHVEDSQYLGPRPWAPTETPKKIAPYTRAEVLGYYEFCCAEVAARVPALDLAAASGFHWLPFNTLEVQLYNLRHLQHHTGQLADRLRTALGVGVGWVRPE
jgi:hypothetical protein